MFTPNTGFIITALIIYKDKPYFGTENFEMITWANKSKHLQ